MDLFLCININIYYGGISFMADHHINVTTIHSEEYKHLTEMVLRLKRSIEVLKQDNKSLMTDNTRLRKEVDTWMRKSHENLRLSFKGNNE